MKNISYKIRGLVICILLIAAVVALNKYVLADSPAGITVSPAYQQVSIPTGQSSVPIKFTISNHESKAQSLKLTTQDFNTLGETGGLVFVGSNPTELQKKYGLAKWLSLPQSQVTIQPGQTLTMNASILNLPDLNPGGHYGALMLSLNSSQPNANVSLRPIASSLLFVTKLGGDTHQLGLKGVDFKHNIFNLPSNISLRFHNDGNTHVIPRGLVTITDPNGKLISKGIINSNSDIILPETYRVLNVPLQKISSENAIVKYKLTVDFRLDGYNQFRRYQTSLWVTPLAFIIAFVIILILPLAAFIVRRRFKSK